MCIPKKVEGISPAEAQTVIRQTATNTRSSFIQSFLLCCELIDGSQYGVRIKQKESVLVPRGSGEFYLAENISRTSYLMSAKVLTVSWRKLVVILALCLVPAAVIGESLPEQFFGMNVLHAISRTPWPDATVNSIRLWDTDDTRWSK